MTTVAPMCSHTACGRMSPTSPKVPIIPESSIATRRMLFVGHLKIILSEKAAA